MQKRKVEAHPELSSSFSFHLFLLSFFFPASTPKGGGVNMPAPYPFFFPPFRVAPFFLFFSPGRRPRQRRRRRCLFPPFLSSFPNPFFSRSDERREEVPSSPFLSGYLPFLLSTSQEGRMIEGHERLFPFNISVFFFLQPARKVRIRGLPPHLFSPFFFFRY